jgi:hypothetical protein
MTEMTAPAWTVEPVPATALLFPTTKIGLQPTSKSTTFAEPARENVLLDKIAV